MENEANSLSGMMLNLREEGGGGRDLSREGPARWGDGEGDFWVKMPSGELKVRADNDGKEL